MTKWKGGLNLPDIKILIKVRRIKMLIEILKDKNMWNLIARKHICSLDKIYGNIPWFNLCVTDSKEDILESNIPKFYQECVLAYQELCQKSRLPCIWDGLIWCNSRIMHNNKSLRFKHWAKSGIKWLSELGNGGMDNNKRLELLNKLTHKAGFIFEYRKLEIATRNTPDYCFHMNDQVPVSYQDVASNLCNTKFRVLDKEIKSLVQLSAQDLYTILLSADKIYIKSKDYWSKKFPNEMIDFDVLFKILFSSSLCDRKCSDFNWKIFHGQVNTEKRLLKMGFSNGICKICNIFTEDIFHLFSCNPIEIVWNKIEHNLQTVYPKMEKLTMFNKLFGILYTQPIFEEINMILSQTRWLIWKNRCKNKFEVSGDNHRNLLSYVMGGIRNHLRILLQIDRKKQRRTLIKLSEIFT